MVDGGRHFDQYTNLRSLHLHALFDHFGIYAEVVEEGVQVKRPQVGVLIEVPAAVYQARLLAKEADFVAVGSNDLTQYLLAIDRNNPRVAELYQEIHPAVITAG